MHGVEVERPARPVDIEISEDADELSSTSSYPVKVSANQTAHKCVCEISLQVTIERLDAIDEENKTETVHAKYVLGSDGESVPTHIPV